MLSSRLAARPRRTLLIVALFVIVAGVLGGPVAGALKSSGGFVAPGADSQVAVDRVEAATHVEPDAGIVLLVDSPTPAKLAGLAHELGRVRGVAKAAPAGRNIVTGVLRADADDDAVAQRVIDTFPRRDVTVGGE